MKTLFTILATFIITTNSLYAQLTQIINFSQSEVSFSQNGAYDVVSLPNTNYLHFNGYAGQPQLPIKSVSLLLPSGAKATAVSMAILSNQQITGSYNLYPNQPPTFSNSEEPPAFVEPDPTIYNTNTDFPANPIYGFNTQTYRDYTMVNISFCPFVYKPLAKELSLATQVELTITYTTTTPEYSYKLRPYDSTDEVAFNEVQNKVLNPNRLNDLYATTKAKVVSYQSKTTNTEIGKAFNPTELPALAGSPVPYVIITNDTDIFGNPIPGGNLTDIFQDFADWKTQNGTPAKVVTVDAIRANYQGVDIPEQIRSFIQDSNKLWGTEYILLGGNATIVPTRMVYVIHTDGFFSDTYYSAIIPYTDNWNADGDADFCEINMELKQIFDANGDPVIDDEGNLVYEYIEQNIDQADYYPDIAVGRAPVDTFSEAELFNNKNYTYARLSDTLPTDTSWLNNQLNIGGFVDVAAYEITSLPTFKYIEETFTDTNPSTPNPHKSNQYTMFEYYPLWDNTNPIGIATTSTWSSFFDPNEWPANITILDRKIWSGGADHTEVLAKINEKPGIIFHIDHSGTHTMGLGVMTTNTTSLSSMDWINYLSVDNKYPIIFGNGCDTAHIEKPYYVGEHWLTSPQGGVAYIGTSDLVHTWVSYDFSTKIFDDLYGTGSSKIGHLKNSGVPINDQNWMSSAHTTFSTSR